MKALWIAIVFLALPLYGGVLTLDDGGVIEADIIKIESGNFVYKDVEGKIITLPMKRVVGYEQKTGKSGGEGFADSPEMFAPYTVSRVDLQLPFSTTNDKALAANKIEATLTFGVKRIPNPETRKTAPKIRTPYAALYLWVEKPDRKDLTKKVREAVFFGEPSGFRSSRFAMDQNEREKILRSNRRHITDLSPDLKKASVKTGGDLEFKFKIGSKLKDAKILAYRLEVWGLDTEKPLEVKEWKSAGAVLETNWWYNAK